MITAGVCAFSLTSRITQRDGTTGRDAPGSPTLLYPSDPGPHRPGPTATFTGVRPPAGTPAYSMIPGWRPPPGPGSPGVGRTRPKTLSAADEYVRNVSGAPLVTSNRHGSMEGFTLSADQEITYDAAID